MLSQLLLFLAGVFFGAVALATAVLLFIFKNTDNDDDEQVGWFRNFGSKNASDFIFTLGIIAALIALVLWIFYGVKIAA